MATQDASSTPKSADNPYFKTYLKQHKNLKLPRNFTKLPKSKSSSVPSFDPNDRTDFYLPKTKLFTIDNVLSPVRCRTLIKETSKLGYVPIDFEYPEDYRKCTRVICHSPELAQFIWNSVIPFIRRNDIEDIRPYGFGNDGIWRPTHLNEAIRFTRYGDGDFFKSHRDGGFTRSNLNRSVYTLMIYLNDPDEGTFDGGDTVFYSLNEVDPKLDTVETAKGTKTTTTTMTTAATATVAVKDKDPMKSAKTTDSVHVSTEKDGDSTSSTPTASAGSSSQEKEHRLFLTEPEEAAATQIVIRPKTGRCVIFNHDVWHKGTVVTTNSKWDDEGNKNYKFILRTDIMFECFDSETFDRDILMKDPLYVQAQRLYQQTIDLQNKGAVRESTVSYLKALSIQSTLPSVVVDKDDSYYGAEYEWFSPDVYFYIFSFLDVYRLVTVCKVSRAWKYYGTAPNLWKNAYHRYFDPNEVDGMSHRGLDTDYNTLFRPWKHLFSYRFMIKNQFPVIALNLWVNGVEIASTSKKDAAKEFGCHFL